MSVLPRGSKKTSIILVLLIVGDTLPSLSDALGGNLASQSAGGWFFNVPWSSTTQLQAQWKSQKTKCENVDIMKVDPQEDMVARLKRRFPGNRYDNKKVELDKLDSTDFFSHAYIGVCNGKAHQKSGNWMGRTGWMRIASEKAKYSNYCAPEEHPVCKSINTSNDYDKGRFFNKHAKTLWFLKGDDKNSNPVKVTRGDFHKEARELIRQEWVGVVDQLINDIRKSMKARKPLEQGKCLELEKARKHVRKGDELGLDEHDAYKKLATEVRDATIILGGQA